jgi:hypothetical protein
LPNALRPAQAGLVILTLALQVLVTTMSTRVGGVTSERWFIILARLPAVVLASTLSGALPAAEGIKSPGPCATKLRLPSSRRVQV